MIREQETSLEERPPSFDKGLLGGVGYLRCERQRFSAIGVFRWHHYLLLNESPAINSLSLNQSK